MKERVAFQTNVPVTVALAYPDGIQVEGRYGDQVMYTLVDERVMYVPPIVRSRIDELGVGKGDFVTICKAERREGTRRFVEWHVERPDTNDSSAPQSGNGVPHVATKPNGNAVRDGAGSAETTLHKALMASIEVALAAEQYGCAKGLSIRFGSEDLRAMALSLFIQHARDRGVR
jgi:hypothetical protein